MTPAFRNALSKTLGWEGGFSNHPDDGGGPTMWGITQKTYDAWRKTTGREKRPVGEIEHHEMQSIYYEDYWVTAGCEALPEDLAAAVFDMAVMTGPWTAKRTLQRTLGVRVDGVVGRETIDAAKRAGAVLPFLKARAAHMQEILMARPSQVAFLEGWINRLLDQAWR